MKNHVLTYADVLASRAARAARIANPEALATPAEQARIASWARPRA
jgi:hypothetical protein